MLECRRNSLDTPLRVKRVTYTLIVQFKQKRNSRRKKVFAMKVASPPLIGSFFLPSLGLAVFSLAVGYWISRKKNTQNEQKNKNTEVSSDVAVPIDTASMSGRENLKEKKKKHQCGCGSNETSKFDKSPSQIKIMYGTLMGKSKVCVKLL